MAWGVSLCRYILVRLKIDIEVLQSLKIHLHLPWLDIQWKWATKLHESNNNASLLPFRLKMFHRAYLKWRFSFCSMRAWSETCYPSEVRMFVYLTSVRSDRPSTVAVSLLVSWGVLAWIASRCIDVRNSYDLKVLEYFTFRLSLTNKRRNAPNRIIWAQKQTSIEANPDWYRGAWFEKNSWGPMRLPTQYLRNCQCQVRE